MAKSAKSAKTAKSAASYFLADAPPPNDLFAADSTSPPGPLLGGDRNQHGCIASAGYEWCPGSTSCVRRFEMAGIDFDAFCDTTSGESEPSRGNAGGDGDAQTGATPAANDAAVEDAAANSDAATTAAASDDQVTAATAAQSTRRPGVVNENAAADLGASEAAYESSLAAQREASRSQHAGTAVGVAGTLLAVAVFAAIMRQRQAAGIEPSKHLDHPDDVRASVINSSAVTKTAAGTKALVDPGSADKEFEEEELYEEVLRSRRAREPLPAAANAAGTDVQYDRSTSRGPSTPMSPIYAAVPPGACSPGMAGAYDVATVEGQLPGQSSTVAYDDDANLQPGSDLANLAYDVAGQLGTDVAYDVANLEPGSDLVYDVANTTGHDYRIDPVARAIPKADDYPLRYRVEAADYRQAPSPSSGVIYQLGATPGETVMSPSKVIYDHAADDLAC